LSGDYSSSPWARQSPVSYLRGLGSVISQSMKDFVVQAVTLGQVFLRVVKFSSLSIIPSVLHTSTRSPTLYNLTNGRTNVPKTWRLTKVRMYVHMISVTGRRATLLGLSTVILAMFKQCRLQLRSVAGIRWPVIRSQQREIISTRL